MDDWNDEEFPIGIFFCNQCKHFHICVASDRIHGSIAIVFATRTLGRQINDDYTHMYELLEYLEE